MDKYQTQRAAINALEPKMAALTDDELRQKTVELKGRDISSRVHATLQRRADRLGMTVQQVLAHDRNEARRPPSTSVTTHVMTHLDMMYHSSDYARGYEYGVSEGNAQKDAEITRLREALLLK